jgi:DNA-directed RNA polymerase specialized sigma24 family protein
MTDDELLAVSTVLRGWFRKRLRPDDVDDAVQDVLLGLIGSTAEIRCLRAYALGSAKNWRCARIREKLRFPVEPFEKEWSPPARDNPLADCLAAERRAIAVLLVATFSGLHRELLDRFYLQGHDAARICADLGISLVTFRNEKHRALAVFNRKGIEQYGPQNGHHQSRQEIKQGEEA